MTSITGSAPKRITFDEKGHHFVLLDPQTYKCDHCDMEYTVFVDGDCNKKPAMGHTIKRQTSASE